MMMFRLWQNALLDKVTNLCGLAKVVWNVWKTTSAPQFLPLTSRSDCSDRQPLCPKELWHFVHQCYGNELGLTSDDEDYVPPDDDFNTMGSVCVFVSHPPDYKIT